MAVDLYVGQDINIEHCFWGETTQTKRILSHTFSSRGLFGLIFTAPSWGETPPGGMGATPPMGRNTKLKQLRILWDE